MTQQICALLKTAVAAYPECATLQKRGGRISAQFLPPRVRSASPSVKPTPVPPASAPPPSQVVAKAPTKPAETPDARAWRELCDDLNRLSQQTCSVQDEVAQLVRDIRDATTLSAETRGRMLTRVENFICMKMQQKFLAKWHLIATTKSAILASMDDARSWMDDILANRVQPVRKGEPQPRGFRTPEEALRFVLGAHTVQLKQGGQTLKVQAS